jgi:hypothetical protein
MFNNNKQSGRTRVNFVSDTKHKKTHVQHKKTNMKGMTGMTKLIQLQNDFFKDGMSPKDYKDYIQDKVNNDKHYYKNISSDDFEALHKRYSRMVQEKENNVNLLLSERKRKKRQTKLFKDKKRNVTAIQKRKIIELLYKEISKTKALGISKNCSILSTDPDQWNETKKLLFLGGRYFESHDKNWVNVYQKLVSGNTGHLFGINSYNDFNNYVNNSDCNIDNITEEIIDEK